MDALGEHIVNEFDCPLMTMSNILYCIPSKWILHAVSIVHECSNTCLYSTTTTSERVEQIDIQTSKLTLTHDWTNKIFCFNIYCME